LLKLYSMRREPVNTGFDTIRGRDNAPDPSSMYGAEPHMPASGSSELPRVAYPLAKYRCTNVTAMAPSPTADAHLFTDPCLTSPAANIPGMLVSR
jgi:hypothetical protein